MPVKRLERIVIGNFGTQE